MVILYRGYEFVFSLSGCLCVCFLCIYMCMLVFVLGREVIVRGFIGW